MKLLLLLTLLTSCNTIKVTKIMHLNLKLNACFVYCFNPNTLTVIEDMHCGIDFVSGKKEISACDKVVGVPVDYYSGYLRGVIRQNVQACQDLRNPIPGNSFDLP